MDNTDSNPQLQIPTIPNEWCPKGTLALIFNQAFQTYLSQATINIPGLGNVTPQEIQKINDTLQELQNQIDALQNNIRYGEGVALAAGDQTVAVTFGVAMPNAKYDIHIEIIDPSGTGTVPISWALVSGTKTTTGFSLRFMDIPANTWTFNWTVRQIPT